jgi:hypothetical protein
MNEPSRVLNTQIQTFEMGQQESKPPVSARPESSPGSAASVISQIEELTNLEETMTKRSAYLSSLIQNDIAEAIRKKQAGDTAGAMVALKRKKMKDAEIDQLSGKLLNLEQMRFSLQSAAQNKDYVSVLQM